jgi:transcriptional regulator with XRE-family HTH domain
VVIDALRKFTANLRQRRTELGLSQEAAAAAADMDQSQYSRIERGEVDPSIKTLTRIAHGVQTTASDLLRGV